jgi:hypothetical protein
MILTPGRTGSTLIQNNLRKYFNNVQQSHEPNINPKSDNCICLISRRKNTLNSILSQIIGGKTEEYDRYTGKKIKKFKVEPFDIDTSLRHHTAFYNSIRTEYYNKIIEVYYEDIILDPGHLFSLFGISAMMDYTLCQKSPYNYYDLIENIDELIIAYNQAKKIVEQQLTEHPIGFKTYD